MLRSDPPQMTHKQKYIFVQEQAAHLLFNRGIRHLRTKKRRVIKINTQTRALMPKQVVLIYSLSDVWEGGT